MSHPIASKDTIDNAARELAKRDTVLASVIEHAPRPSFAPHGAYYRELVESIISQQLSVKAARTILNRFLELFPGEEFPTPESILSKSVEDYRTVGLSRQKAGYIQDMAQKVIDGTVQFDHFDSLSNDAIIEELTAIKGVGVWTAHMFLMFCMGRLDVLPVGDLGIKNGIRALYAIDHVPSAEEIEEVALKNSWHPYQTVASWYIWHSLDNAPKID